MDVVTATSTFVFDEDAPVSTVTFPINGDVQQNPVNILGVASDLGPAGLQTVQIALRLDNPPTAQTAGPEDFYYNPSSFNVVNHSSFSSTTPIWLNATLNNNNWSFATSGIWISGKYYWAQAQAIDHGRQCGNSG